MLHNHSHWAVTALPFQAQALIKKFCFLNQFCGGLKGNVVLIKSDLTQQPLLRRRRIFSEATNDPLRPTEGCLMPPHHDRST
jgi:hypothetical protein